ncbi:MAG: hypothetical protein ABSG29_08290 [Steroidobacteraceae bacterium]
MSSPAAPPAVRLAGHAAAFDARGRLIPWTSWSGALELEMRFYRGCPMDRGYPRFGYVTFLDSDWIPHPNRTDTIPATQIGMGILSYLKYAATSAAAAPHSLATARALGDYLIKESLTPSAGKYPRFTRSTGTRERFPLPPDAGSQGDRPFEIEPDKGGIAGYALVSLFEAAGGKEYLDQALQNARVLAANQAPGDAFRSPWPFRVDFRSGEARGEVSGNMTYILRLYDALMARGFGEFAAPRAALWDWIEHYQIASASSDGALFAQFFEDHDTPTNRTAWAPLNLARYLLEKRDLLDRAWRDHCAGLVDFVRRTFTHQEFGVTVCHEQDEDKQAWGGVVTTYGAVLAMYAKALGPEALAAEARQALDFALYNIDAQGRPRDVFTNPEPGGWQEDAHTDVIHNYVDALRTYPEWAA